MANAKLVWTPLGASQQEYIFPVNFSWEYEERLQDGTDRDRALDGTLRSYSRGLKQNWRLVFRYVRPEQKNQFLMIKQSQSDLDFYRDAAGPLTMRAVWVNDFDFSEIAPGSWSGTMELAEL